jgi:hypothetical protein
MLRAGVAVAVAAVVAGACNSGGSAHTSGAAACVVAGGQCVAGLAFCANVGASPASCLGVADDLLCCATNPDAKCSVEIQASSYDQSCKADSDCTKINVGDPCEECVFACEASGIGAINVGAMAQYMADVGKTAASVAGCGCPEEPNYATPACCRGGQCHADNECAIDGKTDAADASVQ